MLKIDHDVSQKNKYFHLIFWHSLFVEKQLKYDWSKIALGLISLLQIYPINGTILPLHFLISQKLTIPR